MINWPIIPMVYNDSFTYMEWLGKLSYIANNHEERIDDCEKNIIDLWAKVNNHETRITTLETWRTDVVDPFIVTTTATLADHEQRITTNEEDIQGLKNWKSGIVDPFIEETERWREEEVDPFIVTIGTWKDETVDPFIETITSWKTNTVDPYMTQTTQDIAQLNANLIAESASRRNDDSDLNRRLSETDMIAKDAQTKANRLEIAMNNVGAIRYFLDTAIVETAGGNTSLSVVLPDEDWVTCDVRFGLVENSAVNEYRLTITNDPQVTQLQVTQNGKNFWISYDSTTTSVTVTVMNTVIVATDIQRFDYILYAGALTQAAQDQADIDFFNAMDADGDGLVDAIDASMVLSFYSDAATGVIPDQYEGKDAWTYWATNVETNADPDAYPDFNGDGFVDAIDAASILGYYSFVATTDVGSLTGPELMKMYRTQIENEE